MLNTLKKYTKRNNILMIAVGIIAIVLCFVFTKFAVFDLIQGPQTIDLTADPSQYEGKWVKLDVDYIIADYVEHYTETTRKYGGTSRTTDGNSFICFYAVDDYIHMTSNWYYYSLYVPKGKQDPFYQLIDDTIEYWKDTTGTVAKPEAITVQGTWEKLDGKLKQYYLETLTEDLGMEEDEDDIFLLYTINTDHIGGVEPFDLYLGMGIALLALIFVIVEIVKLCGNGFSKPIRNYLQEHPELDISAIEMDFSMGQQIGKTKVWVGKRWTVYVAGTKARLWDNQEIVWAYYYRQRGRSGVSQLRAFPLEGKMQCINLSEKDAKQILDIYSNEQPHMVVGYSDELQKLYNKDRQAFLNLKYHSDTQQQA